MLLSRGGGAGLGVEGVVVLICRPNGVAPLGVAVRGLGLSLLDGQRGFEVLSCLLVFGCCVRP